MNLDVETETDTCANRIDLKHTTEGWGPGSLLEHLANSCPARL
jgi:hypothetical protein